MGRFNRFEFNSVEVLKHSVIAGVGIAPLPEFAVSQEVREKKLVILPWSEGSIEVAILMIWYLDRWLSSTLQAFMDVVRKIPK